MALQIQEMIVQWVILSMSVKYLAVMVLFVTLARTSGKPLICNKKHCSFS